MPQDQPEIVAFVDPGFSAAPFAAAIPELEVIETELPRATHPDFDPDRVTALVTGAARIGADDLDAFPNLRLILTASIGTNHLDLEAMFERGLTVCNTPEYCVEEVADHSLAAILMLWRGLPGLERSVRAGDWDWAAAGVLRRFSASTLGVIGLGRIGRSLARKALALGIEVVGYDPYLGPDDIRDLPGARLAELDQLLAQADGVSLHCPIDPDRTGPLLGRAELERMKPGAVLVNAARARHVDLDTLAELLADGRIAAASFDVWESEPPAPGDRRLDLPNLQLTPHAAWYSPEADRAYIEEGIAELRGVLVEGRDPVNPVRRP